MVIFYMYNFSLSLSLSLTLLSQLDSTLHCCILLVLMVFFSGETALVESGIGKRRKQNYNLRLKFNHHNSCVAVCAPLGAVTQQLSPNLLTPL